MVESAAFILEDATYEKNVYVMKDTCIQRKSQVSDVYYSVNLALPRGEYFGGQVTVNFKLSDSKQDLFLDFRGIKIGQLLINGQAPAGKDLFRDHHIHLPAELLKCDAENEVTLFILTKYRKDGMGLHTFIDKQDNE